MAHKPPDGLKLPKITHCRLCNPPPNIARIAFVDVKPDKDGITWAIYVCLDCAMDPRNGKDLWVNSRIPYTIGK